MNEYAIEVLFPDEDGERFKKTKSKVGNNVTNILHMPEHVEMIIHVRKWREKKIHPLGSFKRDLEG